MAVKRFMIGVFVVLWTVAFAPSASANSAPPPSYFSIVLRNLPEDAVYADLLIRIKPGDPNYASVNAQRLEEYGFERDAGIARYDNDGFRSFTFHYKDAASVIRVYDENRRYITDPDSGRGVAMFAYIRNTGSVLTQYEDIKKNYSAIKLAILNDSGEIISVSEQVELPKAYKDRIFSGYMEFDCLSGEFDLSQSMQTKGANYAWLLLIALLIFLGWTVGFSLLVAAIVIVILKIKKVVLKRRGNAERS